LPRRAGFRYFYRTCRVAFVVFILSALKSQSLAKEKKMKSDYSFSIGKFRFSGLSKRRKVIFGLTILTFLLTTIIAFATIPGPGGVINACYKTNGGDLRVIDSNDQCKSSETALNFNQTGPPGPAGASGTSQVYSLKAPGPFFVNSSFPPGNPLVATKDVPAGSYVIDVKLTAFNGDVNKHNIFCSLSTGDTAEASLPDRNFIFSEDGNISYASVYLHDTYTFATPGTINVMCHGELMNVQNVVLTATKVDSIQ
jgi:hypothetical protein